MSASDAASRLTVGTLLDRTFELVFKHWPSLLLVAVPVTLTGYALPVSYQAADPDWIEWLWALPLLLALHGLAVTLATLIVARDADRAAPPETPPLTRALAAVGRFAVLQLLWLPVTMLWGLLLLVPAFVFSVRSLFAANAIAAGRASGWDAVRLSDSLVRRRWWRVAGIMVMFLLPSMLLSWLFDYVPETAWSHWLQALLDGLIYPIGLVGQAVMFFELEREGPAVPHHLHAVMSAARAQTAGAAATAAAGVVASDAPAAADLAVAFSAFEHRGWQRAAHAFHSGFGRLTSQAAGPLLDAANVQLGQRVLDVACGPGYVSGIAASRGALVIGADFSPEMLGIAKEFHPEIEFRIADAEALPFESDSFDAVVMSFLLGHLPHPEKAIAEAYRVLKPAGRFAYSWWTGPDRALAFGLVLDAIRTHGRTDVPLPPGPPFDQFADFESCARALAQAGFDDVRVAPQPLTWRLASADEMFEAYYEGSVRTAGLLHAQTPEALAAIRAAVSAGAEAFRRDGGLEFPMPCWIASGRKP